MRARLIHRFDYRYSQPVLLGPHIEIGQGSSHRKGLPGEPQQA